jgi:hypothetical protein
MAGQTITNLGTGGADLNGQSGSTSGSDSNDPKFLDWPGDNAGNYVYLPGTAIDWLYAADAAALDITSDIDLRVHCALDDWTPAAQMGLISKWSGAAGNQSYRLDVLTDGKLTLYWTTDGSTQKSATSSVATGVTDGSAKWIRATLDVNNGASGYDVKFYTSNDGSSWSPAGTTVTSTPATSIFSGSAQLVVGAGSASGGSPATGKFYRGLVLNGIGGSTVLDVDTSLITVGTATSFTTTTGQSITIARGTSGRKTVCVVAPVLLFGTDDYIQVADNALLDFAATDSFSYVMVVREWVTANNTSGLLSKMYFDTSPYNGWSFAHYLTDRTVRPLVTDASINTAAAQASDPASGALAIHVAVVNRVAQTLTPYRNGTPGTPVSISGVGSLVNAYPMRVGASSDATPGRYTDMEFIGAAVFRRALSAAEVSSITTYYQARLS